jgi:hypothetical protein
MRFLVLRAYLRLIQFDLYLTRGDFHALHEKLSSYPIRRILPEPGSVERICAAVDVACAWYWKDVLCLQRSGATTCLLKVHGIQAQMMIGAQQMPFRAHAWVEVNGRIVNDKPYMREIYAVLDES